MPTQRHSQAGSYTCHVPETVTLAVTRDIRKELDMNNIQKTSSRAEVEAFLARAKSVTIEGAGHGRLVFGLDATASRQPTWDQACHLQAQMPQEVATGGLEIQLIYYRGLSECRASPWVADARRLGELMSRIRCVTGTTQLGKILAHAQRENDSKKVGALVFVGDALRNRSTLYALPPASSA
jgi:hypothetical protein